MGADMRFNVNISFDLSFPAGFRVASYSADWSEPGLGTGMLI